MKRKKTLSPLFLKKKIRVIIFFVANFLSQSYYAYSQNHIVANPKQNIIYYGIPNPLQTIVEGYRCNDIIVTTDNGKIELTDNNCNYQVTADTTGIATIKILSRKRPDKVLGVTVLRVKHLPNPQVMIAGKSGGPINRNELHAQVGLIAVLLNFDIDVLYNITNYIVTIFKNGKIHYLKNCNNAKFSTEIEDEFKNIEVGDLILFSEIKCKSPDGRSLDLLPIQFEIIE